jgi:hypothetical protein
MAKRGLHESYAIRLYADGQTIEEISIATGVSSTSLYKWKAQSLVPGQAMDEWDRARASKRSNSIRLRGLFERELEYAEQQAPGSISAPSMDALSKLGALVKRLDDVERAEASRSEVKVEVDRPALFMENMEWLATKLKDLDPEGLKVLARNFDALIISFKAEHAAAS